MDRPVVNYKRPNYTKIYEYRTWLLNELQADPDMAAAYKVHYRHNPWDFILDWGMTYEPRNIELGRPASIPFVPFPRQVEFLEWVYGQWKAQEPGLVEKSRDCGVTWLAAGFAVSQWLFEPGFTTGFGSRKEELVDQRNDNKCIFEKVRFMVRATPNIFMPAGFNPKNHSGHMRLYNPMTEAAIIGEAGDNIGRGGRTSVYFVDEAAHIEHQETVNAALSENTNCQIDISSVNGTGNAFYKKRMRFDKTNKVFIFDWRQDPRKDREWYQKKLEDLDEVIVAQEIDRDYTASQDDMFIPAKWVNASIDAHKVLGFEPEGVRVTGFDPSDVGDAKGVVNRWGSVLLEAEELKKGDITDAIPWAFRHADEFRADVLVYDGDGMGAPTMKLALQRKAVGRLKIIAYHGSAGVVEPGGRVKSAKLKIKKHREGKTSLAEDEIKANKDTYENFRAQTWTWMRVRFENTYYAIERAKRGMLVNADPEDLISISSECKDLQTLVAELSRPMRIWTNNGKIRVESKKEMKARGVDSPNLADSAIMAGSVSGVVMKTTEAPPPVYEDWGQSVDGVI